MGPIKCIVSWFASLLRSTRNMMMRNIEYMKLLIFIIFVDKIYPKRNESWPFICYDVDVEVATRVICSWRHSFDNNMLIWCFIIFKGFTNIHIILLPWNFRCKPNDWSSWSTLIQGPAQPGSEGKKANPTAAVSYVFRR